MHNLINLCTTQCLQPSINTNNYSCYKYTVLCLVLVRLKGIQGERSTGEKENSGKSKIKA